MAVAIKCVDVQRLSEHRVVTRHARRVSRGQTPPVGGAFGAVTVVISFTWTDRDDHVTESNCNATQSDGNLTQSDDARRLICNAGRCLRTVIRVQFND